MKRLLRPIWAVLSSRAVSPVVIGLFLLIYIGIAFFTDEALTTLIGFTSHSVFLAGLFALLPLNCACRLAAEISLHLGRRRALAGNAAAVSPELFDETVSLPASGSDAEVPHPAPDFAGLEGRLGAAGYRTHRTAGALSAWRGFSAVPARIVYLTATFCLLAGILISLTSRLSLRSPVVEGEPLPSFAGERVVEKIALRESGGMFLSRTLTMEVAPSGTGEGRRAFGLYPPSLQGGFFVYPRYLGIGLVVRLSAPGMPAGFEKPCVLNIYPPGKEEAVEIPGSPYRIVLSLADPGDGTDPYISGRMAFLFKVMKDTEVVFTGKAAAGGEVAHDGYRIAFPDARRLAITDFIRDFGVPLIWGALLMLVVAAAIRLPTRLFLPRREMLFMDDAGSVRAFSRAEGRFRDHGGVFHEALDLLEGQVSYPVKVDAEGNQRHEAQ